MSSVLSLQPLWLSGLHGCTSAAGSVDSCPRESFTEIVSPEMLWTVERAKPSASAGTQHGAPTVRSAVDGMIVPIEARSERRRPAAQREATPVSLSEEPLPSIVSSAATVASLASSTEFVEAAKKTALVYCCS